MAPTGDVVPTPNLLLVLSQNKFALLETVFVPFQNVTRPFAPVPVTGFVSAFCLLLNVVQSVLLNAPLFIALAVGRLNVCVEVADEILKSVPVVPVANVCVEAVRPFRDVMPEPPPPPDELIV